MNDSQIKKSLILLVDKLTQVYLCTKRLELHLGLLVLARPMST